MTDRADWHKPVVFYDGGCPLCRQQKPGITGGIGCFCTFDIQRGLYKSTAVFQIDIALQAQAGLAIYGCRRQLTAGHPAHHSVGDDTPVIAQRGLQPVVAAVVDYQGFIGH